MPSNSLELRASDTQPTLSDLLATGPFHAALHSAIHERGLGLDRLRHRLQAQGLNVSTTSLSYWQHGRTQPEHPESIKAVAALEEILNVPDGSLRALLGPRRARGPRSLRTEQRHPEVVLGGGKAVRELCDRMPLVREHHLDIVTQHLTVTIDEKGREAANEVRSVLRARRDGVDRQVILFRGEHGCDIDAVHLNAMRDCEIGQLVKHPTQPVLLAEILFHTTLAQGEIHLVEFELVNGTGDRVPGYGQGFRYPVDRYTLQVRFHESMLPQRIFHFAQSRLDSRFQETGDLSLNSWHSAHMSVADVKPGALGIGWEWSTPRL